MTVVRRDPRARAPAAACARDRGPGAAAQEASASSFGSVIALRDISLHVDPGTVTCVLGDNGAGKSTLIKILSGVHQPTEGELLVAGEATHLLLAARRARGRDRDGLPGPGHGAADVGVAELLPRQRAADAGSGRSSSSTPTRRRRVCREELLAMGIDIRDLEQPVGTLSGGERQAVAIARAVYFGAKVLILDEPTSALGVKQSGVVLKYILQARERGDRGRVHHPQPAPRAHGRRPLLPAQPRPDDQRVRAQDRDPRGAGQGHGRWCRAGGARPRARRAPASARRGETHAMETLKVGIIGAGWMGHVHARAYRRLGQHWPDLRGAPGARGRRRLRPSAAAETFARAHGDLTTYADWRELLADPDIAGGQRHRAQLPAPRDRRGGRRGRQAPVDREAGRAHRRRRVARSATRCTPNGVVGLRRLQLPPRPGRRPGPPDRRVRRDRRTDARPGPAAHRLRRPPGQPAVVALRRGPRRSRRPRRPGLARRRPAPLRPRRGRPA